MGQGSPTQYDDRIDATLAKIRFGCVQNGFFV